MDNMTINMTQPIIIEIVVKLIGVSFHSLAVKDLNAPFVYVILIFVSCSSGRHCNHALRRVKKKSDTITYVDYNGNNSIIPGDTQKDANCWQATCIAFYCIIFLSLLQYPLRHFRNTDDWKDNIMVEKIKYVSMILVHSAQCCAALYRARRYVCKPRLKCVLRVIFYAMTLTSMSLLVFDGLFLSFINADCHVKSRQMFYLGIKGFETCEIKTSLVNNIRCKIVSCILPGTIEIYTGKYLVYGDCLDHLHRHIDAACFPTRNGYNPS